MDEALLRKVLAEEIEPLHAQVKRLEARLDTLERRFDTLEETVREVSCVQKIEMARSSNSCKGMNDALDPVPRVKRGKLGDPPVFPATLQHLVVGDTDLAPNAETRSMWDISRSRKLIQFYDDGYESDHEGRDDAESSRQKRLCVARMIGVTASQVSLVAQASYD